MKSAMEIKEKNMNKRKEYINSLNFDNVYLEISNRIENASSFSSYVIITHNEMLKWLSLETELDTYLNTMGRKELRLFIDTVSDIVVSKLKSLKYIIVSYYKCFSIFDEDPVGLKIYWEPDDVPTGVEKL